MTVVSKKEKEEEEKINAIDFIPFDIQRQRRRNSQF